MIRSVDPIDAFLMDFWTRGKSMRYRSPLRAGMPRWLFALCVSALLVGTGVVGAGCSDDAGADNNGGATDTGMGSDVQQDAAQDAGEVGPDDDQPSCDSLQPNRCELPWPSNLFLKPDESRTTGYTLNFGAQTLPATDSGDQTRPDVYRRLDGYSPDQPIIVHFPDIDTTALPGELSIEASIQDDSPTVLLEVDDSGSVVRRVPHFAELDARALADDKQVLFVRPAVILDEATRYVVGFRNLQDTSGSAIEPSESFQKLRDAETGDNPILSERQARFDEIFSILESEGVQKGELTLGWDFVTASSDALHGPMLHMRDRGLEITDGAGPELNITSVEENPETDTDKWWLRIEGTFESPRFMKDVRLDRADGVVFNLGSDGLPAQNGTHEQDFWLYVPQSARDGSAHGLIQYGHGLLGKGSQTGGGHNRKIANDHKFIFFGTSLAGMSAEDVESAAAALTNLNRFPFMADRLHQGILEYLLLARSMRERLPDDDEMTSRNININTDELFYSGISQGGIFGGTYMALSTDVTYGHLGVPGQNYSMLLHRSVDFDPYLTIMKQSYSAPIDQTMGLATIQLLWSQTEPSSYLRHITAEPFEGNDPHYALFAPAKGDYQVSPLTIEIAARSDIGIKLMENYGRDVALVDEEPYPYTGSGVILYDFGNPWPAPGNHTPNDGLDDDPHGKPRDQDAHTEQLVHFLRNNAEIIDVCGGEPCVFTEAE
jgi:hypothetical protein